LGYIGIVWPKEHSPEVRSFPPGTPCINWVFTVLTINCHCSFVCFHGRPWKVTDVPQPSWLFVPPALDVPTLATRRPRVYRRVPHSSGGSWNLWAGNRTGNFSLNADFHGTFRDLLHAANMRHGTHGFTSVPKEGVLRIFPPLKIRRLRPGLDPRTWVSEASTLTPRPPK
jgi:5-methylcytosine-specific restriction endonuclease McrA